MRKIILLAAGLAVAALAGTPANADVRAYWDQASGKWLKYDTDSRRMLPKSYSPIVRQTIDYSGPFHPNTIVIDTAERRLYYILGGGRALKYGVGVGREGFQWSGADRISRKAEWPDWTPPQEMVQREKANGRILPDHMAGGPKNPLGARALYIGGTLYRIHGSNEPWTIGHAVSSGCIRLTNEDIVDLYSKVSVGTRVVVLTGKESKAQLYALANPPPPPPKEEPPPAIAENVEPATTTKDDQVVVLAPAEDAVETTGSVAGEARVKDDDVLVTTAPQVEPIAQEPDPAAARLKDDSVVAPPAKAGDVTVIVNEKPAVAAN
jgi:lipoprotein-anchoring transpeptidase ErfK/SrfK